MLVIFGASTNIGSPHYTSRFVGPILRWLMPSISPVELDAAHFLVRKTAHLTEYAILAMLLARALRGENFSSSMRQQFVLVILLCAFYAASDEWHQSFVRNREASVTDVLLDTSGAALGMVAFCAIGCWRKRK